MCAEVQILFRHKKQDDSVISLQRLKLPGLGKIIKMFVDSGRAFWPIIQEPEFGRCGICIEILTAI